MGPAVHLALFLAAAEATRARGVTADRRPSSAFSPTIIRIHSLFCSRFNARVAVFWQLPRVHQGVGRHVDTGWTWPS